MAYKSLFSEIGDLLTYRGGTPIASTLAYIAGAATEISLVVVDMSRGTMAAPDLYVGGPLSIFIVTGLYSKMIGGGISVAFRAVATMLHSAKGHQPEIRSASNRHTRVEHPHATPDI